MIWPLISSYVEAFNVTRMISFRPLGLSILWHCYDEFSLDWENNWKRQDCLFATKKGNERS